MIWERNNSRVDSSGKFIKWNTIYHENELATAPGEHILI